MMMLICYFFPAIIAVKITELLKNKKMDIFNLIVYYCFYCLLINGLISAYLVFIGGADNIFISEEMFTHLLVVKYIFIALLASLLLPLIVEFILKNVKINIDITKENVKKESKKKRKNKK